jgi:hypothetical protein
MRPIPRRRQRGGAVRPRGGVVRPRGIALARTDHRASLRAASL